MGRKKKEKKDNDYKDQIDQIDLIPVEAMPESDEMETEDSDTDDVADDATDEAADEITDAEPMGEAGAEEESESSALFGAYVAEENKWERKNRIKDEKIRAREEKKRAKYAEVDDDTYEQMKAGGVRKFFGVLSLLILIAGIGAVALFVYRLVFAPAYVGVGEKERNLHVEGFATETDTSKYEQQVAALQGIATPSDLTDTWVEQPFEQATSSDASEQDMDGASTLPADDADAKPVVVD